MHGFVALKKLSNDSVETLGLTCARDIMLSEDMKLRLQASHEELFLSIVLESSTEFFKKSKVRKEIRPATKEGRQSLYLAFADLTSLKTYK